MLKKYKLQVTPECRKCKAPTRYYRLMESQFINQRFIAEWFQCMDCGKIQAKIVKLLGQTHGCKLL